ncbi:MAG: methyltransferase domain-containing protein [Bacillota bacterium]|nr:methyltransferase domain-containing protein [Bacillota bacterium]
MNLFEVRQTVKMSGIDLPGRVLDVGGGGEGIIGRLLGERAISIDKWSKELTEAREAGSAALMIEMDATDMRFLDESFDACAAFFSLMYMEPDDQEKVFKEAWRVLKRGADFWVWDIAIPPRGDREEDVFVVWLDVEMHGRSVRAGYGAPWARKQQDLAGFRHHACAAGFEPLEIRQDDQVILMRLRKPPGPETPVA